MTTITIDPLADERAAAEVIERYLVGAPEIVDPATEAHHLAVIVLRAIRPKVWERLQAENDALRQALQEALLGGLCPHCGQLLS